VRSPSGTGCATVLHPYNCGIKRTVTAEELIYGRGENRVKAVKSEQRERTMGVVTAVDSTLP